MDLLDLGDFRNILVQEVGRAREKWRFKNDSDAFVFWTATQLLGLRDEEARAACRLQGPGERGVDLFHVDDHKRMIIVGQGEVTQNFDLDHKFGRSPITKLRRALSFLNDPSMLKNTRLLQAASEYLRLTRQRYFVEFWVLIAGRQGRGLANES